MYQYWSACRPILVTARSNIGRVTEQYCSALCPILLFLGRSIALSCGLQKKGVALSAACLSHPITRTLRRVAVATDGLREDVFVLLESGYMHGA